ncbi:hypothetical protein AX15_000891 [Amanita polypyramis BW_CC]|nr:hypothetical protein AX15_000891 [Amanita polypyramis BW_CC]
MDELLHYCLRELSFDGDLGCSVTRLKDFIVEYYTSSEPPIGQCPDDSFCTFVWPLIVGHSTVQVGLKPPDVTSEVWIAPQTSAKRKVKAEGEEAVDISPSKLIPIANAKSRPLADLIHEYGNDLRIAIEPDAIYAAITGTHIRSSKLSAMVYTALQIITRGRDNGVSVVKLGQQTKYDQKTCFYLVKQLTELDLVVKVRRGGIGTHSCIHKYFFERNPSWKAIREEEVEAEGSQRQDDKQIADIGEEPDEGAAHPGFRPIDARHLSSLPLVRARVVKLLQASKNYIHPSNNMLVTIGFTNPTKTDRRFFQSRIRELLQQGVIEKVVVPSRRRKSGNGYVKCFRLVTDDVRQVEEAVLPSETDGEKDEAGQEGIKVNLTVHKQIVDLLEYAGAEGLTLHDLSTALGAFDKRTAELLLSRAEKYPPPAHLKDLGIVSLMETSGRERRHRYFTTRAYRELLSKENFETPDVLSNDDFTFAGWFSQLEEVSFYVEKRNLQSYQDDYKDKVNVQRPRKRPLKNPILPDGRVKLGRPRKQPVKQSESEKGDAIGVAGPGASESYRSTPIVTTESSQAKRRRTETIPREHGDVNETPVTRRGRKRGTANVRQSSANTRKSQKRIRSEDSSEYAEVETRSRKRARKGESTTDITLLTSQEMRRSNVGVNQEPIETEMRMEERETLLEVEDASEVPECNAQHQTSTIVNRSPGAPVCMADDTSPTIGQSLPSAPAPIDPQLVVTLESLSNDSKTTAGPSNISRTKVNVSHLRRENEIYRVLVEQGGIVNVQSKEFYVAHRAIIEILIKAGEATSAPIGTTLDKRTLASTLDSLERRGRIRQLRTSVTSHTGASRPICVAYLPDLAQEKLNNFLADLSRIQLPSLPSGSYVKIDEQVEFGANVPSTPRSVLPLQLLQVEQPSDDRKERWSKNITRARQLFSYDNDTIRDVLLTERTTLAQYYGFVVGKIARARHLHLSILNTIERQDTTGFICREHSIIDFPNYCQEMPLELYCSLISVLSYNEELKKFLSAQGGRQTPVRNLSVNLHSSLQVGRSRARARFLEILEVLWLLGLAVPLQLSTSEQAMICCTHGGDFKAFEPIDLVYFRNANITSVPTYWQLVMQAPVHMWALSENSPPVWKQVRVSTEAESRNYWRMLQEACTNPNIIPPVNLDSGVNISDSHTSLCRSLRRTSSWASEYVFTWHQTQYMKQFMDLHTGRTPLQEGDESLRTSKVNRIAWVTSAPEERVYHFYSTSHSKLVMELEKARNRSKQKGQERKARATTEAKALLARKMTEAKQQREQDWEGLVSRLHPLPIPSAAVVRLKRIRTRFVQATSIQNHKKWESEITDALREAELATKKLLRTTGGHAVQLPMLNELQVSLNGEKSVDLLIAQQGPAISTPKTKAKRKRTGEETGVKSGQRRHRFLWNHDYDELARDASAIIRARCRSLSRLDWGAFEQVFPAVPRNTVRQRLSHIRESPGNEAYLNRLEERWHELWLQFRGTPALPDEDPLSPTNFDLTKHIEFLRAHIDKNALRVGFARSQEKSSPIIPSSVDELLRDYIIQESIFSAPLWDFMWNATVEEGREKRLMHQSFTKYPEEFTSNLNLSSESASIAEAALKMTLGTPHEHYEAERASNLLRSANESAIECARDNLLARGVLSKLVRDPQKQKPGRQLKISEANQNAIGGSVSRDTFIDAATLEELSRQDNDWREWPLLAVDGDAAALIQAVSDNRVQFRIDTSQAQSARPQLDWNSKKADDDQIETTISIKFDFPINELSSPSNSPVETPAELPHLHLSTTGGVRRCCKGQTANGLVDCEVCLHDEWMSISSTLEEEEKDVSGRILDVVHDAGVKGISKTQLRDSFQLTDYRLFTAVRRLTDAPIPLIFWTGYNSIILVHSVFLERWTVIVLEDPLTRLHPRRWFDIEGRRVPDYWEAALRSVMGVVIFRPGITQHEIRWRLRAVYDRQEVNDVLSYLSDDGYLQTRQQGGWRFMVLPLDDLEERETYWFPSSKAWYQAGLM